MSFAPNNPGMPGCRGWCAPAATLSTVELFQFSPCFQQRCVLRGMCTSIHVTLVWYNHEKCDVYASDIVHCVRIVYALWTHCGQIADEWRQANIN